MACFYEEGKEPAGSLKEREGVKDSKVQEEAGDEGMEGSSLAVSGSNTSLRHSG